MRTFATLAMALISSLSLNVMAEIPSTCGMTVEYERNTPAYTFTTWVEIQLNNNVSGVTMANINYLQQDKSTYATLVKRSYSGTVVL